MAIPHAQAGEVIDVRPLRDELANTKSHTLFKGERVEVIRMVLPAGKELPEHKARGEITVQCLEGKIEFTAKGKSNELTAGKLICLSTGEPHSLRCLEEASLLLTILLPTM
jgi:quercetin dioxygenase-like cupin family protein